MRVTSGSAGGGYCKDVVIEEANHPDFFQAVVNTAGFHFATIEQAEAAFTRSLHIG